MRIALTGLLALALVLGPGWLPCIAFHQKHPASAARSIDPVSSHQGHVHHQHAMVSDDAVSDQDHAATATATEKDRTAVDENACPKCCSACILTSVMPRGPEWTVASAVSRIFFPPPSEQLRGRIVFVDPDIPKFVI